MIKMSSLACMLAAACFAQSFNLDIGGPAPGGAGLGTPAPTYGAAAAQTGFWNYLTGTSTAPFAIVNLMRNPTGITCTRSDGLGGVFGWNNGMTTGHFQALMDDGHNTGVAPGGVVTYTFSGLVPATYTVWTYGWSPLSSSDLLSVTVTGSSSPNPQVVGGALVAANTFTHGITHVTHVVSIGAGMDLVITCSGVGVAGVINGIQVCDGFALTLTQAAPGFPVVVNDFRGIPGYVYANLATLTAGSFPNGPLFGIEMTFEDAFVQITQGPPFFGYLGPNGTATFSAPGLPPGVTAYCVGVMTEPTTYAIVAVTLPFYYTIL
jgi:hypothetical protein